MSMTASVASPVAANPLARFTIGLFGLFPMSLTMLVLPFWKLGLTKWDGRSRAVFRRASSLHR
jgi:hypothetical protein